MTLSECIDGYVLQKREAGVIFETAALDLTQFSRHVGLIKMDQITTTQVCSYLDRFKQPSPSCRAKHHVLNRFFEFWCARGEMLPMPMPPLVPRVIQTFVAHVFSRNELLGLLEAVKQNHNAKRRMDERVLRTFIVSLFATGAAIDEMLRLKADDVDVDQSLLTFRSRDQRRWRTIPICSDLRNVLVRYAAWRAKSGYESPYFFMTKDNLQMSSQTVCKNFARLRGIAGVTRPPGDKFQPRLTDLRCTFAVKRITSWIREGKDLNRLLPSLAAYMGQNGLGSTQRYLSLTPERYQKHLDFLSPLRGAVHWRNDADLMAFIGGIKGTGFVGQSGS